MLARSFFYILWAALLSISLCVLGVIVTFFLQGDSIARGLLRAWIIDFNGILVGATGYGLLFFVRSQGKSILAQLNNIIEIPQDEQPAVARFHHRSTSWLWTNFISVPLTIAGAIVLWNCGFPLKGFAKWYLAVCTTSLYYVASTTLAFLVYTLALFKYIEERSSESFRPRLKRFYGLDIETLDGFFVISATLGLLAIYVGFRGTLTASFTSSTGVFRTLLILPVLLYLPAALFYSFYPRYVLRRLFEHDIIRKIEELERGIGKRKSAGPKDDLELQMLLLDLKTKMIAEHRSTPLLGFKDAPSLTISLFIVFQLILQKDNVIAPFIEGLFK